ncbi:POK9 protein, partial [Psilopogon haemacephalus]|nr:POK9 protein [Psilopogon haemacephalus]
QLRSTVSQFGVTSEPAKQMIEYFFGTQILLPADCRAIAKLIFTPHQQILFTNLQPATRGSLGLDLAAAVDVTFMTSQPYKIPTNVKGPVVIGGKIFGALLLGRSSASMLGLFVLPGIIDADYTGEIMIMAYTPFPPIMIIKGQKIAQLVPLEQITKDMIPLLKEQRQDKGFGSSGDLTLLPKQKLEIEYQGQRWSFLGLLDTGADSSIISPDRWPKHWPLQPSAITVTGVGGLTLASRT